VAGLRIGGEPTGRALGNRKQRGFRALTFCGGYAAAISI
jgi:hypothetical protein